MIFIFWRYYFCYPQMHILRFHATKLCFIVWWALTHHMLGSTNLATSIAWKLTFLSFVDWHLLFYYIFVYLLFKFHFMYSCHLAKFNHFQADPKETHWFWTVVELFKWHSHFRLYLFKLICVSTRWRLCSGKVLLLDVFPIDPLWSTKFLFDNVNL